MSELFFDDSSNFLRDQAKLGLCAQTDPEAFFPTAQASRAIKKLCDSCVVEEACRTYGIQNPDEKGVWGGLDQTERQKRNLRGEF